MADYTQFKVNELKDILRQRNLSLSGTKSELINRLHEDDQQKESGEAAPAADETATSTEPAAEEPEAATEENTETAAAASSTEEPAKPQEEEDEIKLPTAEEIKNDEQAPVQPALTDDEYLEQVKKDLEQQIARAKRFGSDTTELEARQKRILKFGIGAVRDAASKANTSLDKPRRSKRKNVNKKKFNRGPKPATA